MSKPLLHQLFLIILVKKYPMERKLFYFSLLAVIAASLCGACSMLILSYATLHNPNDEPSKVIAFLSIISSLYLLFYGLYIMKYFDKRNRVLKSEKDIFESEIPSK